MSLKDAYYFPHFCNARCDRKIKRVMKELGPEGYAIFFMLLEVLREQTDFSYPIEDIDLLADEFMTSEQKVRTVITNYNLFQIDEHQRFFSIKQIEYLKPYLEKSERARKAALIRWEGRENQEDNANAMQMQCAGNAKKAKQSKGKQSKAKQTDERFDEFWKAYPRKVNKAQAEKAWLGADIDGEVFGRIISALSWQTESDAWTEQGGKFIPYPSTYLNQRRWEDEQPETRMAVNGYDDPFRGAK